MGEEDSASFSARKPKKKGGAPVVPMQELRAYVAANGSAPAFLKERMETLQEEREYIDALPEIEAGEEDAEDRSPVRLLTDAERTGLLQAFLAKQEQVDRCFEQEVALRPGEDGWRRQVTARYEPQFRQL